MAIDYGAEASELLFEFVGYHRTVKQHSEKTLKDIMWMSGNSLDFISRNTDL